jgi:RHS repeat-associated protein
LAIVSDRRIQVDVNSDGIVDSYKADIVSANDYYPFGMLIPGRKYSISNTNYRYGFNGKELDKDISGTTTYDYGFRIYNPGLGRFLSVDPMTKSYPWYTPYQYAGNKPTRYIDRDGLEESDNDLNNSMLYQTYQIKASITNTLIRLSPNREKAKLREEFAKGGITDETFISNYQIRLRTIVTNHPGDEVNPQAWFEIENKYVIEPKNSFGKEAFEAAFDVLCTLSVLPSPGSTGFLAAKGGGQILIGEFRRSMGILFNVKRLSIIGETRAALQGVQKLEDIMEAGKAFLGKNAIEIFKKNGKLERIESKDGLRSFRPPIKKSFGGGTMQANFEQRINKEVPWEGKASETQRSNMHVTSDRIYTP